MERWHLSWVTAKELYTRRPLFFSSVVVQGGERKKRSDSILHDSPTPPVENTRRARIGQRWVQLKKKKVKRKRRRRKCAAVIITRALGGTLLCCIHTSLHFFCCLVAACICWAVCSVFLTALLLLATVSTTTGTDTLLGLARSFHLEASFFPFFSLRRMGGEADPTGRSNSVHFGKGARQYESSLSAERTCFSLSLCRKPPESICGEKKKKRVAFVSQLSQ